MKKIIVIGCPGSGKSTFSKKLSKKLNIPLYHLDNIWHKPDKTNISRESFDSILEELLSRKEFIIDGNYLRTLEKRIKQSDTIIFFDLSTETCLEGIKSRVGIKRDDLPWIEETLDLELENSVKTFKANQLPIINEILNKYITKKIIIFKTREDADDFLNKL